MKPGDRVRIATGWSTLDGELGTVVLVVDPLDVARLPYALVEMDKESSTGRLRFGLRELEVICS